MPANKMKCNENLDHLYIGIWVIRTLIKSTWWLHGIPRHAPWPPETLQAYPLTPWTLLAYPLTPCDPVGLPLDPLGPWRPTRENRKSLGDNELFSYWYGQTVIVLGSNKKFKAMDCFLQRKVYSFLLRKTNGLKHTSADRFCKLPSLSRVPAGT